MSEGSGQRSVSSVLESNKFGRYDKVLQLRSGRTVPRRACVVTLSCKDLFLFKSASTSKLVNLEASCMRKQTQWLAT